MPPSAVDPPLAIPTIDITPFTDPSSASGRFRAGKALVDALHTFGFAKITGHGVATQEIDEALSWVKNLFDLPSEEKMKAPHPAGPMPHRGYSGIGREKIYDTSEVREGGEELGKNLRMVLDFKESYEIGSERDDQQQNIWLPDDVLPGFQTKMTALYERLAGVGKVILSAIGAGLALEDDELVALMELDSERHSQLRLLHYPAISKEKVVNEVFARLPAHTDWGAFTMLFQDGAGGLELKDRTTGEFLSAEPEKGALVVNIGDMLERFTNDYFVSAMHRVSVPCPEQVPSDGIPARYSIPFFVGPKPEHVIATLPRFITSEKPVRYEPVKFCEYGAIVSKYQYRGDESC